MQLLELTFKGWFECRLATDPDPADEPRGVSGSTFAAPGEPDLDRVIRFHRTAASRVPGYPGVYVTEVSRCGASAARSLLGAAVILHREPRFEGRNGLLARPGREPIDPLDIEIRGSDVSIRRDDPLDEDGAGLLDADPVALARRAGQGGEWDEHLDAEMRGAAGVTGWGELRRERANALRRELEATSDELRTAALQRRLAQLTRVEPVVVRYRIRVGELGGRGAVIGALGLEIDSLAPWPLELTMGAWDADALCGFVTGTLGLPVVDRAPA